MIQITLAGDFGPRRFMAFVAGPPHGRAHVVFRGYAGQLVSLCGRRHRPGWQEPEDGASFTACLRCAEILASDKPITSRDAFPPGQLVKDQTMTFLIAAGLFTEAAPLVAYTARK